ncbi:MAG: haloalkane dehalogenase [Pseudomonadota bacterium]
MLNWIGLILVGVIVLLIGLVVLLQASTDWKTAESIRTPDERFANLVDYPFTPNYIEIEGYRIHYVDEGPRDGETILLLHGQPSWSYLYRHMIPPLVDAGYRVIAPDLVGFGKSDKPLKPSDHNYQMHIDLMTRFARELDLQGVTFFMQDWGGMIGLRMIAEDPDRYARIMLSNTGLPAAGGVQGWIGFPMIQFQVWREGKPDTVDDNGAFRFTRWIAFARHSDQFDLPGLFQGATTRTLSEAELEGYAAPFPDETYRAATRIFPFMVPSQLRQNQKVMDEVFAKWDKPLLTAFGDSDPVTVGRDTLWQETVPGAANQAHTTIEDGHHFIQEDKPEELVQVLIAFIEAN